MSAIHDAMAPGCSRLVSCHLLPGLENSHSGEKESNPQGSSSGAASVTSGTVDATARLPSPGVPLRLLRTTTTVTDPTGVSAPLLRIELPAGSVALSSAVVGGGLGGRREVANLTVSSSFSGDPVAWLAACGVAGDGVVG